MAVGMAHVVSGFPRCIVFAFVLIFYCVLLLPWQYNVHFNFCAAKTHANSTTSSIGTSDASVRAFWADLASALRVAQAGCAPLKLDGYPIGEMADFQPVSKPYAVHPERMATFTEADEAALLQAHYRMRLSAQHLAPLLPFAENTMGIVTTANAAYMPVFLVTLRVLRRTGCKLPVEVFVDDWNNYDTTVCNSVLPSLNARCVVLSDIYNTAEGVQKPVHFQYKIFAILFSSFHHVLFLDADAIPAADPTELLSSAPYTVHGLVTWPDYWALTTSVHFYHIAAIPPELPQSRYSTESGQLLLNKHMHRESLLMMIYYNYYGPDYYYILLSQGSHGAGDKETFVQAALAVGLPYYQVRTGPTALGHTRNGEWQGVGIAQADPRSDFTYLAPARSHIHSKALWTDEDIGLPKQNNNTQKSSLKPHPMFLHQNGLKLDPKKVLQDKDQVVFEPDGTPHRIWGTKHEMMDLVGYDVEKVLWDAIVEEACRVDARDGTCVEIKRHVQSVFGD